MNGIALNRIPGFQEALRRAASKQAQMREAAWKNLPRSMFGFTVRMMTVRDYVILDHYGSPFLNRAIPRIEDLAFFFWMLSPNFERWNNRKVQFGRSLCAYLYTVKVRRKLGKDIPEFKDGDVCFQAAIKSVFGYIEEMFIDAPASVQGNESSGVCFLAHWFDWIQSEHGLSADEVWSMPIAQLFQRIKAIQIRNGVKVPSFNRAEDELKSKIISGISSKRWTIEDLAQGRAKFWEN